MSAWPEVHTPAQKSGRASRSAKAALRKKQRDEEAASLRRRIEQTEKSPRSERRSFENFRLLSEIHRQLCGQEFRAWYEMTTGEPVDDWLKEVVLAPEEFIESRQHRLYRDQLEWTEERIRAVADRNPWSAPERRAYWGQQIAACTDPRRRRALLLRMGTPRWADKNKMLAIYRERARVEAETGIPHEVDHVVPIVSQHVCGLHWEGNLRIITAAENIRKSNYFNPDSFCD